MKTPALILQGANFLVLDEPTNNLDIGSVERLEAALLQFLAEDQGSILTISHDIFQQMLKDNPPLELMIRQRINERRLRREDAMKKGTPPA